VSSQDGCVLGGFVFAVATEDGRRRVHVVDGQGATRLIGCVGQCAMRCGTVVKHDLARLQGHGHGSGLIGARHDVSTRIDTVMLQQLLMGSGNHPHTSVVFIYVTEGHPAGDDGIWLAHAEVVVVLMPVDLATGVGRFVQPLTEDQPKIRTDERLDSIQDSSIAHKICENGMKQVGTANLL
ncbi:uncharacterized protein METZ01_LOCUS305818, partial [marine metagenome]